MKRTYNNCTPKSPLGKAISYAFGMWPRISRYCKEGCFHIDNNAVENTIRPIALGRLCCATHNLPYVGNAIMLASLFIFLLVNTK